MHEYKNTYMTVALSEAHYYYYQFLSFIFFILYCKFELRFKILYVHLDCKLKLFINSKYSYTSNEKHFTKAQTNGIYQYIIQLPFWNNDQNAPNMHIY